jgi:Flp pilus assembly protein TadG
MYRVSTFGRSALNGRKLISPKSHRAGLISHFNSDERGNVAIMFGLMLTILVGFVGASVDIGRWMLARKQTHDAMDTAVLAGLKTYQSNGQDKAAAEATALANYTFAVTQSGRGTTATNSLLVSDTVSFKLTTDANGTTMTTLGDATVKTPFIGSFMESLGQAAGTGSKLAVMKINASENSIGMVKTGQTSNIEISVMIDITGSMSESDGTATKIATVKKAANDLVQMVVSDTQSPYTSRVAIVPFSEAINLGTASLGTQARGSVAAGSSTTPGSAQYDVVIGSGKNKQTDSFYISSSCVTERLGTHATNDVSPATASVGRYYSATKTNTGDGACPTAAAVVPLTSNKVKLKATIDSLQANGTTAGHMGTAWAWYMLSPNFNTLWASSGAGSYSDLTTPNSLGAPTLRKIAILMTDGDYNTEYCNGVAAAVYKQQTGQNCTPNNGTSNTQAAALCAGMKNKQIEVYTIGAMVSTSAKTFLKNCATDESHYYDATNTTKLTAAFQDIALKLVPPMITH